MLAVWALSNLAHENGTNEVPQDEGLHQVELTLGMVHHGAASVQREIGEAPNMLKVIVQQLRDAENEDVVEKVLWLILNLARLPSNRFRSPCLYLVDEDDAHLSRWRAGRSSEAAS